MIKPVLCDECGTQIVFLNTTTGAKMPVDTSSLTAEDRETLNRQVMIEYDKERHTSHFKTCTNPQRFSGKNQENVIKELGFFVYLEYEKDGKTVRRIQSKGKLSEGECSNIKQSFEKISPRKIYKIGKILKINSEKVFDYRIKK